MRERTLTHQRRQTQRLASLVSDRAAHADDTTAVYLTELVALVAAGGMHPSVAHRLILERTHP